MGAQLIRAAAWAALTSAIGYGLMSYRKIQERKHQQKEDKLAAQEWETDGGGNIPARPAGDSISTPGFSRTP